MRDRKAPAESAAPPASPAEALVAPDLIPDSQAPCLAKIEAILAAGSIEELWQRHVEIMADFGFDRLLYGFKNFLQEPSVDNLDDFLVLSNHPKSYLDGYIRDGLYRHAPMLHWASRNVGATSWRRAQERHARGEMTEGERRVIEFNRRHGVIAGYTISFLDNVLTRSRGAIALCARAGLDMDDVDAIWAQYGRQIMLINSITHMRVCLMPQPTPQSDLTPRQRETLEGVGAGKTAQQIARQMGVSRATVEKHLRLAREALGVQTTAQAVLMASFKNQIYVMPA
ncbi:LuxR family transcriptional regulator [Rhodobacteraceae bacterium WD3A24]|nr:LuxR family transcriptional regulator [Rhodobacteraceae bacterium WD3A24]